MGRAARNSLANARQLEQTPSWLELADPRWAAWQLAMAVHGGPSLCRSWELLLTKGLQHRAKTKLKRGRWKGAGRVFRPVS